MTVMATHAALGWERDIDDVPAAVAVSGPSCVVAGEGGGVHLLDSGTGQLLARLVLPGGVTRAAFSPDGTVVAIAGPRGYALWRVADGGVMMRTTDHPARFAWSAGNLCAVASAGSVRVYDAATGMEEWRPVDGVIPVDDLTWFDRGTTVAAAVGGEVHTYSVRGRAGVWSYPAPVRVLAGVTSGAWLCSAGDVPGVYVRGVGGTYEDLTTPGLGLIDALTLDDTGQYLAAQTADGGLTVWDLAARGGRVRPRPRRLEARVAPGAGTTVWRPGGEPIVATGGHDGTLAVWDVRTGSARRQPTPLARRYCGVAVTALAWFGAGALVHADRGGRVTAESLPELA